MKAFLAALQFLTAIPLPRALKTPPPAIKDSLPFFPIVGLIIGGLTFFADLLYTTVFPTPMAAVLTIMTLAILTGGLHLDGLADTADGLFSVRDRDRILEIMRDSRTGVMGVLALIFVLLLKISSLLSLTGPWRGLALILAPPAGRGAMILMLNTLPYARPEGGLATEFTRRRTLWVAVLSFLVLGGVCLLAGGGPGMAVAACALLVSAGVNVMVRRRLGGFTGDTLGAASELAETAFLVAAAAMLPYLARP